MTKTTEILKELESKSFTVKRDFKRTVVDLKDAKQALQKQIDDILPRLYQLRAGIPLTSGKHSRKEAKELIGYLEELKTKHA